MLDTASFVIGMFAFGICNILGEIIVYIESLLSRRCNYGMSLGELASFRKYVKNCYDISYIKFRSLDSKDQVSILSSFFGIDAQHL